MDEKIVVQWQSRVSGRHTLVCMWDESIDEIVVNVATNGGVTQFVLGYQAAQRIKRLIEAHEATQVAAD